VAVKPIVIFPGGLNVPQAHPRVIINTPARMTLAQNWWASNSFIPPTQPGTELSYFKIALAYLMTTGATQAGYFAEMDSLLFGEDPLALNGTGMFLDWAYQGNINDATFVAVGSSAPGLPPFQINGTTPTTPSDAFRATDWAPLYFDWAYNDWNADRRNKYLNGWTTTWPTAGPHFGETVKIPSYSTIVINQLANQWGGPVLNVNYPPMPGNNYFHGKLKAGIPHALAIWYEDTTNAQLIYNTLAGPQATSFWEVFKVYAASGGMGASGVPTEGVGYGRYEAQYVCIPFLSLLTMGRDMFAECGYWNNLLMYLINVLSPAAAHLGNNAAPPYYQQPPFSDDQFDSGFANLQVPFDTAYWNDMLTMVSIENGTSTTGKYARQLINLVNQAVDPHFACIETNTSTQDWTADGLPLGASFAGPDYLVVRKDWTPTASVWFHELGRVVGPGTGGDSLPGYHHHMDYGSWQAYRGAYAMSKEQSGYNVIYADYRFPSMVASSPLPSSTVFAGQNLPTTIATNWPSSGRSLLFLTGVNTGQTRTISNISGQNFTVAAFGSAPSPGDRFVVFDPGGAPPNYSLMHNLIVIGGGSMAGTAVEYSKGGPTTLWETFSPNKQAPQYLYLAVDLSLCYQGFDPIGHPDRDNPYAASVQREQVDLSALECTVILERVQTKTCTGNTAWPAWDATKVPVTSIVHSQNPMSFDGSNKCYTTYGPHTMRVITLLPPAPSSSSSSSSSSSGAATPNPCYTPVLTTDFTGSHQSADWYLSRLEINDLTPSSTRYLMNVVQLRDTSDVDVSATILTQDALTWTVQLTHSKGNAWLILNKGLTCTQGQIQIPQAFSFTNTSYPFGDAPQCFFSDTPTSIVVGSSSGNLYRYDEATGLWTQLPMTGGPGIALHFVIDTETAGKWCFGTATGAAGSVYQYDTATGTVTLSNAPAANQGYNTAVHIPGVYTLVFRGFQGDVYQTTDGVTFSLLSSPTAEAIFSSVLTTGGVVWMGGEAATQTPFKSSDNGATWIATNDGSMANNQLGIAQCTNGDIICSKTRSSGSIHISRINTLGVVSNSGTGIPNTVGQILQLGAKRLACVVSASPPYVSTDDGLTWAIWGSGISGASAGGHLGKTAKNVYYHSGATVYKSPNLA
jgi:hypothetical protein